MCVAAGERVEGSAVVCARSGRGGGGGGARSAAERVNAGKGDGAYGLDLIGCIGSQHGRLFESKRV